MEGVALLRKAADELRAGRAVAECVVLSSAGSVARGAGARMLVLEDGSSLGTVGGGGPELRCCKLAFAMISSEAGGAGARHGAVGDGRDGDAVPDRAGAAPAAPQVPAARKHPLLVTLNRMTTGMVCGGSQLVGIRPLCGDDLVVLDEALACLDGGGQGRLRVVWPEGSVRVGVLDDTGAMAPLAEDASINGSAEGGEGADGGACAAMSPGTASCRAGFERVGAGVDLASELPSYEDFVYSEPLHAQERAIIFGGGHVGRALVPALAAIDFEVVLYDSRPEVARPDLHPAASRVICAGYDDISRWLDIRASDCVCVMTHGHEADEDVVAQVLPLRPRYLGCMGSRKKRAVLERVVGERGLSPEEIASVELPIGLEIGAVTPAEIAVSIAARLVGVRSDARGACAHPCGGEG